MTIQDHEFPDKPVMGVFDAYVHTHDDARDLIRSLAPGCDVKFWQIKGQGEAHQAYMITTHRLGKLLFCPAMAYSLPLHVETISKGTRETLERNFGR